MDAYKLGTLQFYARQKQAALAADSRAVPIYRTRHSQQTDEEPFDQAFVPT